MKAFYSTDKKKSERAHTHTRTQKHYYGFMSAQLMCGKVKCEHVYDVTTQMTGYNVTCSENHRQSSQSTC